MLCGAAKKKKKKKILERTKLFFFFKAPFPSKNKLNGKFCLLGNSSPEKHRRLRPWRVILRRIYEQMREHSGESRVKPFSDCIHSLDDKQHSTLSVGCVP